MKLSVHQRGLYLSSTSPSSLLPSLYPWVSVMSDLGLGACARRAECIAFGTFVSMQTGAFLYSYCYPSDCLPFLKRGFQVLHMLNMRVTGESVIR
jgi:hypothetical protein